VNYGINKINHINIDLLFSIINDTNYNNSHSINIITFLIDDVLNPNIS